MKKIGIILLFFTLMACNSIVPGAHYYQLNIPQARSSVAPMNTSKVLVIAPIKIAPYLNHKNMIMQVGANELVYANNHYWSGPVDNEILMVLQEGCKQTQFLCTSNPIESAKAVTVSIAIEAFHIDNSQAQVLLKANYTLSRNNKILVKGWFDEAQPLTDDGYSQAVLQLNSLTQQLIQKIIINALKFS